jgi:hypothetical protein
MRIFIFIAAMCAAQTACAQDGVRATDRLIPMDELDSRLSGQVLEYHDGSKSRYTRDGTYGYTYTDDGPVWRGDYVVSGLGEVCVTFENGSSRCDLFVQSDTGLVLITAAGMRFPVRNITVDDN